MGSNPPSLRATRVTLGKSGHFLSASLCVLICKTTLIECLSQNRPGVTWIRCLKQHFVL